MSRKRLLDQDVPKKTVWKYTLSTSTELVKSCIVDSIELVRYNSIRDLFTMHKDGLVNLDVLVDVGELLMKVCSSQTIDRGGVHFCVESIVL